MTEILTPKDVAKKMKLSERTVYKLLRQNEIPSVRIQHQYRILESELEDWLKSNTDSEIRVYWR